MKRGLTSFFFAFLFLVIAVSLAAAPVQAEDYYLNSMRVIDVGNNDSGEGVAVDADGNIFVAARLGDRDMETDVLVKYYPSGAIQWTRDYDAGNVEAQITSVAVDSLGNSYATGTTSLNEGGACLTRSFTPSGELRWSQTYTLGYSNMCNDIVVDAAGNVNVAGIYRHTSGSLRYLLLIKYSSSGAELCSITTGWPLPSLVHAMAVDVDMAGNAYVLGHIDAPGYYGIFKYDSVCGEISGPGPDILLPQTAHIYWDIAVDKTGSIYVIGSGNGDIQLVKYAANGTLLKAIAYDSGGYDNGYALALDNDDYLHAAGQAAGGYVAIKYDPLLNLLWSGRWGVGSGDRALGIAVDSAKNIYLTGTSGGLVSGGLEYNAVTLLYSPGTAPVPLPKTK